MVSKSELSQTVGYQKVVFIPVHVKKPTFFVDMETGYKSVAHKSTYSFDFFIFNLCRVLSDDKVHLAFG